MSRMPRIGVSPSPGTLDDGDAARAVRLAGGEAVGAVARRPRPARGRRGDRPRWLLLRRLPARRRHRQPRPDHDRGRRPRPGAGCRCWASATASRSSARRACCPARSCATRGCTSSAVTSACGSRPHGLDRRPAGREIVVPSRTPRAATWPTPTRWPSWRTRAGRVPVRGRQPQRLAVRDRRRRLGRRPGGRADAAPRARLTGSPARPPTASRCSPPSCERPRPRDGRSGRAAGAGAAAAAGRGRPRRRLPRP